MHVPCTSVLRLTFSYVRKHRDAVRRVIYRLGLRYVGMEEFLPGIAPPEYIRQQVEESEVFIGLLGMRYGSIDEASGLSMTELEYRQALASGKPRYMFVMHERARITASKVETNPASFAKLVDFRERVLKGNTCYLFRRPADLVTPVEQTLRER